MLRTSLSALYIVFILTITLCNRYYYYPYFTDEKNSNTVWHVTGPKSHSQNVKKNEAEEVYF